MNQESKDKNIVEVNCPTCKKTIQWIEANSYRPFCSKRCKDSDLYGWATEENRVAGSSVYSDVFSDDEF